MFKKLELWFTLLLVLFFSLCGLLFGSLVLFTVTNGDRYKHLGEFAVSLADIPIQIGDWLSDRPSIVRGGQSLFPSVSGFVKYFDTYTSDDYIVMTRYVLPLDRYVVELRSLNDFALLHTWAPDDVAFFDEASDSFVELIDNFGLLTLATQRNRVVYYHPLVLRNGDLLYANPMLRRVDKSSQLVWQNQQSIMHHSINLDENGDIWACSNGLNSIEGYPTTYIDDRIAKLNQDGEILFEKSVTEILVENGLGSLVFGSAVYDDDPIHLNDVQPVMQDGPFWKQGDVFVSIRNVSMIFLYRPSTNEIVWHRRGPFTRQHDIDIINNHSISVFNNNETNRPKRIKDWVSNVLVYDFETDSFTSPWQHAFEREFVFTDNNGLSDFTDEGHLIVEATKQGRLIAFDKDGKTLWEYINRFEDGNIGYLCWFRYISAEDFEKLELNL